MSEEAEGEEIGKGRRERGEGCQKDNAIKVLPYCLSVCPSLPIVQSSTSQLTAVQYGMAHHLQHSVSQLVHGQGAHIVPGHKRDQNSKYEPLNESSHQRGMGWDGGREGMRWGE
jgi:hypothetical protein